MLLRQNTKKHTAFVILFNIAKAKKPKKQQGIQKKTKKPIGNTKKPTNQNSDTLWIQP